MVEHCHQKLFLQKYCIVDFSQGHKWDCIIPICKAVSLQNFTLAKEELGKTKIGDLSEEDMTKVRSLALIELTALFDAHEIPMNRKKSPSKLKLKGTWKLCDLSVTCCYSCSCYHLFHLNTAWKFELIHFSLVLDFIEQPLT